MQSKKQVVLVLMILCASGFFGFSQQAGAALLVSEAAAGIGSASHEFVELYNSGDLAVDLESAGIKLQLVDSVGKATTKTITWLKTEIPARGYFLFGAGTLDISLDAIYGGTLLTGNGGVRLLDKEGNILDQFFWTGLKTGESWERHAENLTPLETKAFFLQAKPHPQNSLAEEPEPGPEPIDYPDSILINELLPNPDKGEEFIELYNGGDQAIALAGWTLRDASKSGKYIFPENAFLSSGGYLIINKTDFKFALNNSGTESIALFNPNAEEVFRVNYSGSKKDASYNFDGSGWRWSQFLSPGEANIFNNLPTVSSKKDNRIYINVYAYFSAKAADKDKDKLKFTWDFGDGHKSYLQNTKHKYTKTGKYTAKLKVTDGSEDVITEYAIEVIKYPEVKINIVEISPNPKGRDLDTEYIALKNESKKKINLKGWSIATGSKHLVNHPINRNFDIKPGQTKKITRKYSLFSLVNSKAKIELRYPDGRVADKLKYDKKKIMDNEIYKKGRKRWKWILPSEPDIAAEKEKSIEIAPPKEGIRPTIQQNIFANIGKYTENPDWQRKKENLIVLARFGAKYPLLENSGQVLGATMIRESNNYYSFTTPGIMDIHWIVKFWNNLTNEINYFLNNFFLKLAA